MSLDFLKQLNEASEQLEEARKRSLPRRSKKRKPIKALNPKERAKDKDVAVEFDEDSNDWLVIGDNSGHSYSSWSSESAAEDAAKKWRKGDR